MYIPTPAYAQLGGAACFYACARGWYDAAYAGHAGWVLGGPTCVACPPPDSDQAVSGCGFGAAFGWPGYPSL